MTITSGTRIYKGFTAMWAIKKTGKPSPQVLSDRWSPIIRDFIISLSFPLISFFWKAAVIKLCSQRTRAFALDTKWVYWCIVFWVSYWSPYHRRWNTQGGDVLCRYFIFNTKFSFLSHNLHSVKKFILLLYNPHTLVSIASRILHLPCLTNVYCGNQAL